MRISPKTNVGTITVTAVRQPMHLIGYKPFVGPITPNKNKMTVNDDNLDDWNEILIFLEVHYLTAMSNFGSRFSW